MPSHVQGRACVGAPTAPLDGQHRLCSYIPLCSGDVESIIGSRRDLGLRPGSTASRESQACPSWQSRRVPSGTPLPSVSRCGWCTEPRRPQSDLEDPLILMSEHEQRQRQRSLRLLLCPQRDRVSLLC